MEASSYHAAGFGVAYGFTEDNRCLLAFRLAEVRGRLSEHLGADAPVTAAVHDLTYTALQSDHYFRGWFDMDSIRAGFARGAPEVVELAEGYAAGVNRFLRDHPALPACEVPFAGAVTRDDIYLVWVAAAAVASGEVFAGYLPHTAPAGVGTTASRAAPLPRARYGFGSNAWALGHEATRDGESLHLYNPHFPWTGIHRLYLIHVTIPGELDVFGTTLGGFPLPLAGFTNHIAWGLTFSPASRWSAAELVLEGDGLTYRVDGRVERIRREVLEIPVRGEDAPRRLPFYRAEGRPIIHAPSFLLGWSRSKAFAVQDVNVANTRMVEQFLAVARATTVEEVRDALVEVRGVPWSYTVASDSTGSVLFGDISPVPNLDSATIADCSQSSAGQLHLPHGFLILDGNRESCAWQGWLPPEGLPHIIRTDYVANSNNNYTIPHQTARLTGFSRALGGEDDELSLRASLGLDMIQQRLAGTDGHGAPGFDLASLEAVFLDERNRAGELLVDGIVEDCLAHPSASHEGQEVDLTATCEALAAWDRRNSLDSRGAHILRGLFVGFRDREFLFSSLASSDDPLGALSAYTSDEGLRAEVRGVLARVTLALEAAGVPLDARWGDVHRVTTPSGAHSMPGGSEFEGIFDAVTSTVAYYDFEGWVESLSGVPADTLYGGSYFHVVRLGPSGPTARGLMPYSQATEATSPYFQDQLGAWSASAWFDFPFQPDDIRADPNLTEQVF